VTPTEKLEEETFAFARKLIPKSPFAIQMGRWPSDTAFTASLQIFSSIDKVSSAKS